MDTDLYARFKRVAFEQLSLAPGQRVVVGVSGGVDSVVLLHLLKATGLVLHVGHVQYGLRGVDSAADEQLVRTLCAALGVPLAVQAVDLELDGVAGASRQAKARDARYAFFQALAHASRAEVVAVAHHADDQAETVLLHLLRGTGLAGLAGMPLRRPLSGGIDLIRPLLGERRTAIEALARAEGWAWREDASNMDPMYRRNAIRTEVLPRIHAHFGEAATARIAETAALVRGYYDELVVPQREEAFALCLRPPRALAIAALRTLTPVLRGAVIIEALQRWLPEVPISSAIVDAIDGLLSAQPGRRFSHPCGSVWREEAVLYFAPAAGNGYAETTLSEGKWAACGIGRLRLTWASGSPKVVAQLQEQVVMDEAALPGPLHVRPWQAGDRMQPFGMDGHKLVSDMLTDAKVPAHLRSVWPVLVSGETVVWVVGIRLSETVRVTSATTTYATVVLEPTQWGAWTPR